MPSITIYLLLCLKPFMLSAVMLNVVVLTVAEVTRSDEPFQFTNAELLITVVNILLYRLQPWITRVKCL